MASKKAAASDFFFLSEAAAFLYVFNQIKSNKVEAAVAVGELSLASERRPQQ
ncbi:hypothetical protein ACTID9_14335 [Brevibacillus fluminis]|uniref:hypothetical protein n=1 Tax=Brevibacillus fluminis TaxID=511487 RepID=UPI003F890AFB